MLESVAAGGEQDLAAELDGGEATAVAVAVDGMTGPDQLDGMFVGVDKQHRAPCHRGVCAGGQGERDEGGATAAAHASDVRC